MNEQSEPRPINELTAKLRFLAQDEEVQRVTGYKSYAALVRACGIQLPNADRISLQHQAALARVCKFNIDWPEWVSGNAEDFESRYHFEMVAKRLTERMTREPETTKQSAKAMRRSLQDQLAALDSLTGVTTRHGYTGQMTRPEPAASQAELPPFELFSHEFTGEFELERLTEAEQSRLGATFRVSEDQLVIAPSGEATDEAAAHDPLTQTLHKQVQRKGEGFLPVLRRLGNQPGWAGTTAALERLLGYLRGETSYVAERIGDVWSAAVELGSFLELDERVRSGEADAISPLDPEVRRQFSDLLRTTAPFVRQFPTARMLDDESGAFLARNKMLAFADEIVQEATNVSLLADRDRALLEGLIAAAERGDFQGVKAESRICSSAKNLALTSATVVASFCIGAVASGYSNQSVIVNKAAAALVAAEKQILKIFEDAPDDIRLGLGALIKHIKDNRDKAPAVPASSKVALPPTERRRRQGARETAAEEPANQGNVSVRSETIRDRLFEWGWELRFRPSTTGWHVKRISFNRDGTIGEGQNNNEHGWRWNGDTLELIRADGSVHNRFEYEPAHDRFFSNQPSAVHGIRGQSIYRG
jgi:hypothetical protein